MVKSKDTSIAQPVFREPVFSEPTKTVDPGGFLTAHASDKDLYKAIENLLKSDVVSFNKSRMADGDLVQLADVYRAHGQELIKQIKTAKKILFHALGDSGPSNERK